MADDLSFIPTKSSNLQTEAASSFQCVVYEPHRKKNKTKLIGNASPIKSVSNKREADMKTMRHEIFKFAVSSFTPEKKEEAEVALAVKLGARPPKNEYHNYRELKALKQKQKDEVESGNRMFNLGKKIKTTASTKQKSKVDILNPYGKPGKVAFRKRKRKHN